MVGGWWGSLRRGRHRPYVRCVNCGNIEDSVILAHRQAQGDPELDRRVVNRSNGLTACREPLGRTTGRWASRPSPAMIARAILAELFPVRVH